MKLDDVQIPEGAEERAWQVVRAAYEERIPAPRGRRVIRPALALAAALALIGAAISPPGRAVLDSIRETVGVEKAKPALFSLPAQGRLLVTSDAIGTRTFNLTQEFLSQMLAVRRPGVTVTMAVGLGLLDFVFSRLFEAVLSLVR